MGNRKLNTLQVRDLDLRNDQLFNGQSTLENVGALGEGPELGALEVNISLTQGTSTLRQ